MQYSWPGNVRELENAIEHAIGMGLTDEILPEDLPNVGISSALSRLNQTKKQLVLTALDKPRAAQSRRHAFWEFTPNTRTGLSAISI